MIFVLSILCLIVFLFTVYQLSKDDFLFLRKGVSVEHVFNVVFLTIPIALLSSRLFYVLLHPSWRYINPLIFFVVPYFPGLSLVGSIVGAWIFIAAYTKNKKIPSPRLLDMVSLSFLLTFSVWILATAILGFAQNRLFGIEEIARGIFGILMYIVLLLQFIKGAWIEGSMAYAVVSICCLLSLFNTATFFYLHTSISLSSAILTGVLLLFSLIAFIIKQKIITRILKI